MAGYSPKSLVEKLGIKPGMRCCFLHPPVGYPGALPEGATVVVRLGREHEFIHAFFEEAATFAKALPRLQRALAKDGMLWISWRKGKVSDLDENKVRAAALAAGLVDVKVCAVDEQWSGLKLVYRLTDR